jgi:diadenosine tetraphosphate (Ap4A) HIT family hydrolase
MAMTDCLFCNIKKNEVIFQSGKFLLIKNLYKAVKGHCLLITKEHVAKEAEIKDKLGYAEACDKAWNWVKKNYSEPITFIHPPLLQTVPHFHRHYIPSESLPVGFMHLAIREGMKKLKKRAN